MNLKQQLPFVLNPATILWLEDPEKRRFLERLHKAENAVGQFGTILIEYNQGKILKITAESSVRTKT